MHEGIPPSTPTPFDHVCPPSPPFDHVFIVKNSLMLFHPANKPFSCFQNLAAVLVREEAPPNRDDFERGCHHAHHLCGILLPIQVGKEERGWQILKTFFLFFP